MPCFQAGTNNPSPRQERPFHSPSGRTGQSPDFLNFPPGWNNANKNYRAGEGNDWLEKRGKMSLGNGRSRGVWWCRNLRFPVGAPLEGKCSAQFWEDACSPLCLSGLGMWIPPRGRSEVPKSFQLHASMDLIFPQKHNWGAHPALSAPSCHSTWEKRTYSYNLLQTGSAHKLMALTTWDLPNSSQNS